jgi:hypothetical protein
MSPQAWTPPAADKQAWTPPAADAQAAPKSWLDQLVDVPKGIWDSFTQGGQAIVDTAKAGYETVAHPLDTLQGKAGITKLAGNIGAAQDSLRLKAEESFQQGDYATGVRHVLNYLIPALGPGLDASGDLAQKGEVGRAVGQTFGTAAQLAGPKLLEGIRVPVAPALTNPNPLKAAALDYLANEGVPVPAGARTGNAFVKNIQKAVDVTPGGAMVAARAEEASTQALRGTAGKLASRAHPTPIVPEQAGAGIRGALERSATQRAQEAETSYGAFRQLEQQAPMPVDMTQIKAQLGPIFHEMNSWMQPALRNASAGYQAIKSILEGPDVLEASQAEAGLGGLKGLAREGVGRNAGLAKYVVPQLQDAIDSTVASVDPHALIELHAGRTAAATQYGTQAILDDIRTEPVQAFNQMTYAKDAGIDLLRKVNAQAPGEMSKLGRAWLENAFKKAQQEGGFGHSAKLFSDWENLGPQTKRLLFTPAVATDLDKFFLGAKTLAENPNPSGTAVLGISGAAGGLIFTNPTTGIPLALGAGALSKMLHSPGGVKALLLGLKVPLSAPAATLAYGQLLKAAGMEPTPSSGEDAFNARKAANAGK